MINETSRAQKAIQAVQGKNKRVWTITIVSAENPMGQAASPEYNKEATERLIHTLAISHTIYFPTKGLYDGIPENSIFIYNITIIHAKFLADTFNQVSMVFIDITNPDKISYQFWQRPGIRKQLRLVDEKTEFVDATNDSDNYTRICRRFKFKIPFFEGYIRTLTALKETPYQKEIDRYLLETTSTRWTGKHQYYRRPYLYGQWDKKNGKCHIRENKLYELSDITKSVFAEEIANEKLVNDLTESVINKIKQID